MISRRLHPFTLLPLLWSAAAQTAAADPLPVCQVHNGQVVSYDIVRGGNVIGQQTVRYAVSGPDMTVTIDMHASLHVLGMSVYNYQHHGEERWQGGQMVALVTKTNDDGTPRHVDATRDAQTGWHGVSGIAPGMAPLLATSLWNSQTVTQTRLLDRETGQVVAVRVTPAGSETLALAGRQVPARKYDFAGLVSGSAWYDANGCWVRALFHTRVDGSLVDIRAR